MGIIIRITKMRKTAGLKTLPNKNKDSYLGLLSVKRVEMCSIIQLDLRKMLGVYTLLPSSYFQGRINKYFKR